MTTHSVLLTNRALLRLSGRDARSWLQALVTNDVESLAAGQGRYAALLTPQGKIIADFFVVPDGETLLIDCPAQLAEALAKRLAMYKLRADVAIAPALDIAVAAAWGDEPPAVGRAIVYADPRHGSMGWRIIGEARELDLMGLSPDEAEAYAALRIINCVPEGGVDFQYADAFPHEANLDLLNGVDFRKGCYIGQEVVSRVHHRGTARKRVRRGTFTSPPLATGASVFAGDTEIGVAGSVGKGEALIMLRTDKALEAIEAGLTFKAGDTEIVLHDL